MKLIRIQNNWWQQKAVELQQFADACDLRSFYVRIKELFGHVRSSTGTLLSVDGTTILSDLNDILEQWREPFTELLNWSSTAADYFLKNFPNHPPQHWMNAPSTFQELKDAMDQMQALESPGPDNIPF